jgi:hypothetical protein
MAWPTLQTKRKAPARSSELFGFSSSFLDSAIAAIGE